MKRHFVRGFAIALSVLFATGAVAQSELGTITGTVNDSSQAVLRNVKLTITNKVTNVSVSTLTNEDGRYVVPGLKPGSYKLEATLSGFKLYAQSGVILQVNQTARVDIAMAVGNVSEQITVQGGASALETETSSRGEVIDERKIVELPLNGRDYNQLALLAPGVLVPTPRLTSIGFRGAFNVNGNRAFQNSFLLDGVDNVSYATSYRGNNVQVLQPSVDALQEFKIQTNAYTAEFGRSAGAIVNAVIKSGTNDVHGSAYEFFRNRDLDSTNFFSNKSGADKPFRLRNQFGGTFGGPIIRNKTFIFGDYEGLRDRTGTVRFSSVPQPNWTQGKFTMPIYNPNNPSDTGQDFRQPATADCNDGKGNCWIIPKSLIDPVGQKWVNVAPLPNTGAPGQIDNNYVGVPVTSNRTDQFDIRVDHSVSRAVNLFGRYSFSDTNQFQPAPRPGLAEGSFNDTFGTALLRSQAAAAGATWILTPAVLSETRVGYSRGNYQQLPPNFGDGCPEELIGLKGLSGYPDLCGGLPPMSLPGGNLRRLSRTTSVPQLQIPQSYDLRQSVSWIHHNHSIKFGGEYLHVLTADLDIGNLLGNFNFSGRFSGENGQYQGGIADLLLGLPTSYSQDSKTTYNIYQYVASAFVQDDWKVTPKLTLNLGLRYEFSPPPRETDNQWANFDPATQKFVDAKSGSLFDEALIHPDWTNFAPRIGLAYSLFSHTVVRSGYGIFYNHTNRNGREGIIGFNPPFIVQAGVTAPGGTVLHIADAPFRLQDGVPAGFVDITKVNLSNLSYKAQDMNLKNPYVEQWNVGIQQQLIADLVLDVSYVGNYGRRLPAFRNLNPFAYSFAANGAPVVTTRTLAAEGFNNDIQYVENIGISNYHSLQAKLEKRFSSGITGLLSYTWGKALTDSVDHLSTSGTGNGVDVGVFRQPQDGLHRLESEYGPAEFDVTHRFVASAVWYIPYGRGHRFGARSSKPVDFLLGAWEFAPIATAQTGLGLTVTQSCTINLGGETTCRPNRLANGPLPNDLHTVDNWMDPAAFQILQPNPAQPGFTPNQVYGNSGVGILRGPGLFNIDFNLSKNFSISERQTVQFRAEFFNALNHPNFSVPGTNLGAGFGQITSTSTEARIIQFALKYRF